MMGFTGKRGEGKGEGEGMASGVVGELGGAGFEHSGHLIFEGELDREGEAFAEVAGEFDFAAVFANDASNDEQAESAA